MSISLLILSSKIFNNVLTVITDKLVILMDRVIKKSMPINLLNCLVALCFIHLDHLPGPSSRHITARSSAATAHTYVSATQAV
jgi:hypothetical protein